MLGDITQYMVRNPYGVSNEKWVCEGRRLCSNCCLEFEGAHCENPKCIPIMHDPPELLAFSNTFNRLLLLKLTCKSCKIQIDCQLMTLRIYQQNTVTSTWENNISKTDTMLSLATQFKTNENIITTICQTCSKLDEIVQDRINLQTGICKCGSVIEEIISLQNVQRLSFGSLYIVEKGIGYSCIWSNHRWVSKNVKTVDKCPKCTITRCPRCAEPCTEHYCNGCIANIGCAPKNTNTPEIGLTFLYDANGIIF